MNIRINLGGLFLNGQLANTMLKSTQEKLDRQQECENKVAFYENQITMLKDMKTESIDDIKQKLEMFHSYQDSIAETKKAYNDQQVFHIMDEAKEKGEKIAEAAKDAEPKTAEERREEMVSEAAGEEEEEKGMLSEILEELEEVLEETEEEMLESAEKIVEEKMLDSSSYLKEEEQIAGYKPIDYYV